MPSTRPSSASFSFSFRYRFSQKFFFSSFRQRVGRFSTYRPLSYRVFTEFRGRRTLNRDVPKKKDQSKKKEAENGGFTFFFSLFDRIWLRFESLLTVVFVVVTGGGRDPRKKRRKTKRKKEKQNVVAFCFPPPDWSAAVDCCASLDQPECRRADEWNTETSRNLNDFFFFTF